MNAQEILPEVLRPGITLQESEQGIYSVYPSGSPQNSYDTGFGSIYEVVACNPIYNRIAWGYSLKLFSDLVTEGLNSSATGYILDVGCGSLAFSADAYAVHLERPVILLDQSLKLLKSARERLTEKCGGIPPNLVLVHADATQLPFKDGAFQTLISLNLLHVLADVHALLGELKRVLASGGSAFFSTLVENDRLSDHYLRYCERLGEAYSRKVSVLNHAFSDVTLNASIQTTGNMCILRCHS